MIEVVLLPESASAAMKRTEYGPMWFEVGVQVSVPLLLSGLGENTALLPAGRLERSAVSEPTESPSGSAAVTFNAIAAFSATTTVAGEATTGGRSWLITDRVVVAEEVRPL